MPLTSSNPAHLPFLSVPVILIDTGALVWLNEQDNHIALLSSLLSKYSLVVPTPALYEFAFGQPHEISRKEKELREFFADKSVQLDSDKFAKAWENHKLRPGYIYNTAPGFFEWEQARNLVIRRAMLQLTADPRPYSVTCPSCKHEFKTGKRERVNFQAKRNHSLDALIFACARNHWIPICTRDTEDFTKLNEAALQMGHTMPFFTPQQLLESVEHEVRFQDSFVSL